VEASEGGTPQGGIISLTLVNMTLNGLEKAVLESIKGEYKVRERGIYIGKIKDPKGKVQSGFISTHLSIVRFADDFIILARSRRMIEQSIRPCVEKFLEERGLKLSVEKTKILSIGSGDKLNFLGYTFQYQEKFSYKYKLFHDRQEKGGITCYPQKSKYKEIINRITKIFSQSRNLSAYSLIAKVNPVIRGWSQYFNLGQSYKARNNLNTKLFQLALD